MSKLLIHLGPPKTGSTQLQRFFNSNSIALRENSIDYIQCQPKKQIRSYFRTYKEINRQQLRNRDPLKPWYLDCPETYFFKDSPNNNAIISEEALFKLVAYHDEISSFDKFLSNYYSNRLYLAVLREINGHVVSQISQSVIGVWRFDYKNCLGKLKNFSLDRDFSGLMNTRLNLEVATFNDLVINPESALNTSVILENFFGTSNLDLKAIEGKGNASLGSEGTAIHMAYNNILRLIVGGQRLHQLRLSITPFARQFRAELIERFPTQNKFCPYTEEEQSMFHRSHLAKSKEFIKRYPGTWIDYVFTPIIREKNIVFISEFDDTDRKVILDLLESSIHKVVKGPCFEFNEFSSAKIHEAINFFIENERDLVL
jgi:hypothetical protein